FSDRYDKMSCTHRDLCRSPISVMISIGGSAREFSSPRAAGGCMKDMRRRFRIAGRMALSAGLAFQMTAGTGLAQAEDSTLIAKAKLIHSHVLKLDTHNDIEPSNFTTDCNYKMRLTTQVNLPKMVEGGMDISFMIVYVGQGPLTPEGFDNAYKQAIAKFDAVHRFTEKIAPDQAGLALTPADVLALHKKNLRIAVIGVEN